MIEIASIAFRAFFWVGLQILGPIARLDLFTLYSLIIILDFKTASEKGLGHNIVINFCKKKKKSSDS